MRRLTVALFLLIALASGTVLLTRPGAEADPATFTVDSTGDGGDSNTADGVCDDGSGNCTLRAAIEQANADAGTDTIEFDIAGAGPHTIIPSSALPTITDPVVIDGTSEPDFAGSPVIELRGSFRTMYATGLAIRAGNSTVRGLVINGFGASGISLTTNGGNVVEGNYIGTDVTGTVARGNGFVDWYGGVEIVNSSNNTIGGTAAGAGNVISDNEWHGIWILGTLATGNQVQGNKIGTDVTGTVAIPNGQYGVDICGGAQSNTIGPGNQIIADNFSGVIIKGSGTNFNTVTGNLIGTNADGTADIAEATANEGVGIVLSAQSNTIGPDNVISGNGYGVQMASGARFNPVIGNRIGTDISGAAAIPNDVDGIIISSAAQDNIIGGTAPGEANIIAFNNRHGVLIIEVTATGNSIRRNSIHSNSGEGIENMSGGSNELPPPIVDSLGSASGHTEPKCYPCTVEVFSDDEDEGRIYHGSTTTNDDATGTWTYAGAVTGPNITATITDASGNTSEFSLYDTDGDGVGNGYPNPIDNCPDVYNPGQENNDGDAQGDACDPDDDNDTVLDGDDADPLDEFVCQDLDADTCDDCSVLGQPDTSNDGTDSDSDGLCDDGDPDDDNDTVLDGDDSDPFDQYVCQDVDSDTCDDCSVLGQPDTSADGADTDSDGLCDAGDPDDDNDTVLDGADTDPLDPFVCQDVDSDTCDDCSVLGQPNVSDDGTDTDSDGLCDAGDPDDDNDTVLDGDDADPLDEFVCQDLDTDTCDDCSVLGQPDVSDDGTDTDSDGLCDAGDPDDDNDTVLDGADTDPLDQYVCQDVDSDTCDDCSVLGQPDVSDDGPDNDSDGLCDAGDPDDDNDTVLDGADADPLNAFVCQDLDTDTCDDCSVLGQPDPSDDGTDTDSDGLCDAGDPDDDNDALPDTWEDNYACTDQWTTDASDDDDTDGLTHTQEYAAGTDPCDPDTDNDTVLDGADTDPLDPFVCQDVDSDTCDDCSVLGQPNVSDDGTDTDSDGLCDAGDPDDDNDTVLDGDDADPLDEFVCQDLDTDTCDDCSVLGQPDVSDDGTDTDSDGLCDAGDPDDDNDTVLDGADTDPLDQYVCQDVDSDTCDDCSVLGQPDVSDDGTDTDSDGLCDAGDPDDDNDTVLDGADADPLNAFVCQDLDTDTCDDCSVLGQPDVSDDGTDTDSDGLCDAGDPDDDNDTVLDGADTDPLDQYVCQDVDSDTCDDCSVLGQPDVSDDGPDNDSDGLCDAGDPDDDNDTVLDGDDTDPLDEFVCQDLDFDTCDDCSVLGQPDISDDGPDNDSDGLCDAGDPDDDNDTVLDGADTDPLDAFVCQDLDSDTCDDCSVLGQPDVSDDGPDNDLDGLCDAGDPDDDNDTVLDGADADPLDQFLCQDLDSDTCDDCSVLGQPDVSDDGPDNDSDGLCDAGDPDDDNDTVLDGDDTDPFDQYVCQDVDTDTCDDCSILGQPDPSDDGPDNEPDGLCDAGDPDDDNDTVLDGADTDPLDAYVCQDVDSDTCDDCSVLGQPDTSNDGTDTDTDGLCDAGDPDDDNDTVLDDDDTDPFDQYVCQDVDSDTCDDCSVLGQPDTSDDGTDNDSDGACDAGDPDDDNDTVLDGADTDPFDQYVCQDVDTDTCDDCSILGQPDPSDDGPDNEPDGLCDAGDPDDDNDTVLDGADTDPFDQYVCQDVDSDTCDDCSVLGQPDTSDDGTDNDSDGACDAGDPDDDNDTVLDGADTDPFDQYVCQDVDTDTCDDCSILGQPDPSDDGPDNEPDGLCDAGDPDDDNDTVLDGADTDPFDAYVCQDVDSDTCDDCSVLGQPDTSNDGTDTDTDGLCDAGDPDDDNDTVLDDDDTDPFDQYVCQDVDTDTCDDCSVLGQPDTSDDGTDNDSDGACDAGDPDDDNDTVLDGADTDPFDQYVCQDVDTDTCDDCSILGQPDPSDDGPDNEPDGLCDAGDPDDDNDTVLDGADTDPFDAYVCQDVDSDTCDDCSVLGQPDTSNDGTDTDTDGLCDAGDPDDDNDTVLDDDDTDPFDQYVCQDVDTDTCDDCSVLGQPDTSDDGTDNDSDGTCDAGDPDDDNDGWADIDESFIGTDPLDNCPNDTNHDALPPDNNMDKTVNVLDLLNYKPKLLGLYDPRYDLVQDGVINVLDLLIYKPELMKPWPCT